MQSVVKKQVARRHQDQRPANETQPQRLHAPKLPPVLAIENSGDDGSHQRKDRNKREPFERHDIPDVELVQLQQAAEIEQREFGLRLAETDINGVAFGATTGQILRDPGAIEHPA